MKPEEAVVDCVLAQVSGYNVDLTNDTIYMLQGAGGGMAAINAQDKGTDKWAKFVYPMPLVIVTGSFPYKKQVEEYQRQLHFDSQQVKAEPPIFRGFVVERRDWDMQHNQWIDWKPVPLDAPYARLLGTPNLLDKDEDTDDAKKKENAVTRKKIKELDLFQAQPEEEKFKPLLPDGLAMALLRLFSPPSPAPAAKSNPVQSPLPSPKTDSKDGFDIFTPGGGSLPNVPQNPFGGAAQAATTPRPYPSLNNRLPLVERTLATLLQPKDGGGDKNQAKSWDPPDYVIFRFIDGTVLPGGAYQYRVGMRLANPNYQRTDVAFPDLSKKAILTPSPSELWEVPDIAFVPSDQLWLVRDSGTDAQGQLAAQFELQRWLDRITRANGQREVAEWVCAPPVNVSRGEPIPRTIQVQVPIWVVECMKFELATIPVPFNKSPNDAVLVDVEDRRPSFKGVNGSGAGEALILSPEGKLVARDTYTDQTTTPPLIRQQPNTATPG